MGFLSWYGAARLYSTIVLNTIIALKMSWEEHSEKLRRLWEVFLVFTSGIFLLMCFGTPYWQKDVKESDKGTEIYSGLWACCYETGTTQSCYRNTPANCGAAGECLEVRTNAMFIHIFL